MTAIALKSVLAAAVCNHDGRWDDNLLGGGANTPRFYDHGGSAQRSVPTATG